MKDKLTKLINVKSIVTFLIVLVYCYLAVTEKIDLKGFENMVFIIISFYFGTQVSKITQ